MAKSIWFSSTSLCQLVLRQQSSIRWLCFTCLRISTFRCFSFNSSTLSYLTLFLFRLHRLWLWFIFALYLRCWSIERQVNSMTTCRSVYLYVCCCFTKPSKGIAIRFIEPKQMVQNCSLPHSLDSLLSSPFFYSLFTSLSITCLRSRKSNKLLLSYSSHSLAIWTSKISLYQIR